MLGRKRAPRVDIDDYTQGVATLATLLIAADIQRGFTLGADTMSNALIESRIVTATKVMWLAAQGGDYVVDGEEKEAGSDG